MFSQVRYLIRAKKMRMFALGLCVGMTTLELAASYEGSVECWLAVGSKLAPATHSLYDPK